jgi:acetate---CoA ligase (ADP-forming) subunit beta
MSHTLSEHESKRVLAQFGIAVPEERLVDSPEAAVTAAQALGLPVVLKLCGQGIAHKTERGLVRLDLRDTAAVRDAARDLLAARRPDESDARLLVTRMRRGRRELIAGLVRDPQFGPCVMLGLGGIFAEALRDVAFAVAPLEQGDADELIDALEHGALLGPFRGEPAVDRAQLRAIIEGLAALGMARPEIRSVDVNPLLVDGSEPVVVDALVELEDPR